MFFRKAATFSSSKGFPFHDVTPMAGGVAMLRKIGLVFSARFGEGLFRPRVPVDGIKLVLEEIRRLLASQAIRNRVFDGT
jgi:hypothetical protein